MLLLLRPRHNNYLYVTFSITILNLNVRHFKNKSLWLKSTCTIKRNEHTYVTQALLVCFSKLLFFLKLFRKVSRIWSSEGFWCVIETIVVVVVVVWIAGILLWERRSLKWSRFQIKETIQPPKHKLKKLSLITLMFENLYVLSY